MIRIDRKWADKPNVPRWLPGHRIIGLEVQVQQRSPWGENSARGICADSRYRPSPCWPHRDPDAASVRSTGFVELAEAAPPPGAWAWLWYIACLRVACVRACVRACMRSDILLRSLISKGNDGIHRRSRRGKLSLIHSFRPRQPPEA